LRTGGAGLAGISGHIADGRIELRDRDRQAVGGTGIHERGLAVGALRRNRRIRR
jgi:hypothetical protein